MEATSVKHKGRTVGAVGAIGVAAMLGLGAAAYACSAQAVIRPNKTSAPAGATVTGSGGAFNRTLVQPGTPVNIRWNSTTSEPLWSGPSDAKGNISFSIRIPDVANGHYSIVATQGTMVGRAPFEVVGSSSTGTGSGSSGSGDTNTSQGTQSDTSGDTSQPTNTANDNAGSTDSSGTDQAQGEAGQSASTATSAETGQSRPAANTSTRSASPAVARSAATSAPAPAPASSSGPVPASAPTPVAPAAELAEARATVVAEPAPVASATGDLWSGFDSGTTPSLMPAEADSPSSTGSFTAGVALLGSGMVALFAGLFVTVARRRRVSTEG